MAAGILFMSFDAEEMRLHLKPLSELRYFLRIYGRAGISVFLLQHLYYLLESALILFIIVFGQEAGESLFPVRRTSLIPWGGIFCALTWGMLHGLTKDWETALFSLILSAFFVLCYFAAKDVYKRQDIITVPRSRWLQSCLCCWEARIFSFICFS